MGLRTGSPDFERRRKLREDLRGGWDSFLLLWDSGMGGIVVLDLGGGEPDFGVGGRLCKVAPGPFDEPMILALTVIAKIKFDYLLS